VYSRQIDTGNVRRVLEDIFLVFVRQIRFLEWVRFSRITHYGPISSK